VRVTVTVPFHFADESELSQRGRVFEDADAQRILDHDSWHRCVAVTDRTPYVEAPEPPPITPASIPKVTAASAPTVGPKE
jgi:hypothetical protein